MKIEDLILVSVDDHAIEPPNAFTRHMPARFKGREPKLVPRNGRDVRVFEERATGCMGCSRPPTRRPRCNLLRPKCQDPSQSRNPLMLHPTR